MRRGVWAGCFASIVWFGLVAKAESKNIALECQDNQKGRKALAYINANTKDKSVSLKAVYNLDEVEITKVFDYKDGSYDYALKSVSVKSLDGSRHDDYKSLADNEMKSRKLDHQHVDFTGNKIKFWTEAWSNTVDMDGGVYINAGGHRGFCDKR